jgi:monofunctional biosynthetic peptidoglycan transglycosylase
VSFRRALGLTALTALGVTVTIGLYQWRTWPDVAALADTPPASTAFMDAWRARQRAAGRSDAIAWTWVPWNRISVHLKRAAVAAEDMEFFFHDGFSRAELRAALRDALAGERFRGASTITQQLAKNLWLSPSRNPWRKVKEALLTRDLERRLTKRRILELYLNVAEYGPGVYGVEAAARRYFGAPAVALTEHEAAMLAASLPRPASWHPGVASGVYARYVAQIEGRMARATFLWRALGSERQLPPTIPDSFLILPPGLLDSLPPPDSLIPDSLIPDSLSTDSLIPESLRPKPVPPDTDTVRGRTGGRVHHWEPSAAMSR